MTAFGTATRDRTGFQLETFAWSEPERLEVRGRWYGVRGRRFVRPVLTVMVRGHRRRLLAGLEHKPWFAREGEDWIAAFPWEGDHEGVGEAELEVGSLTVDLPPPGGDSQARAAVRGPGGTTATPPPETPATEGPPASELSEEVPAGASRSALERDLAGARAELRRLQQRHENRERELRADLHLATERLEAAEAASRDAVRDAQALREALEAERAARAAEADQLRAAEAGAREEAERERAAASQAGARAEELHEKEERLQTEAERRGEAAEAAQAELERLREAARRAAADNERLKQTARKATAEAERLRSQSRRDARKPADAAAGEDAAAETPPRDAETTVPFEALPAVAAARKELASERAARERLSTHVERLRRELAAARAEQPVMPHAPQPGERVTKRIGAAGRVDPPTSASGRLLGELPQRPLAEPSTAARWGVRVIAFALLALLLVALALIVAGVF